MKYIPYARHYNPRFVYFYPIFEDHFFVFKEIFSQNSVLMYVWLIIKSGLWWRAYSNSLEIWDQYWWLAIPITLNSKVNALPIWSEKMDTYSGISSLRTCQHFLPWPSHTLHVQHNEGKTFMKSHLNFNEYFFPNKIIKRLLLACQILKLFHTAYFEFYRSLSESWLVKK